MKFCTNCGKQLPDNVKFCTGCGTALGAAPAAPAAEPQPVYQASLDPQPVYQAPVAPAPQPVYQAPLDPQPVFQQPVPEPAPKKKKKKSFALVTVILLLVGALIIGGGVWLVLGIINGDLPDWIPFGQSSDKDKDKDDEDKDQDKDQDEDEDKDQDEDVKPGNDSQAGAETPAPQETTPPAPVPETEPQEQIELMAFHYYEFYIGLGKGFTEVSDGCFSNDELLVDVYWEDPSHYDVSDDDLAYLSPTFYGTLLADEYGLDVDIVTDGDVTYFLLDEDEITSLVALYVDETGFWYCFFECAEEDFEDLYDEILIYASSVWFVA